MDYNGHGCIEGWTDMNREGFGGHMLPTKDDMGDGGTTFIEGWGGARHEGHGG